MKAAHQRTHEKLQGNLQPPIKVNAAKFESDISGWLLTQAKPLGAKYLLAHAEDGVIWGLVKGDRLQTSDAVASHISPPLRANTLLQCRLFSETGELFVWRSDDGWRARVVQDEPGAEVSALDEDYVLWGDHWEGNKGSFTIVSEGAQGLRHAVPLSLSKSTFQAEPHPLRITVRHYLQEDQETGQAFIMCSRLVKIFTVPEGGYDGLAAA